MDYNTNPYTAALTAKYELCCAPPGVRPQDFPMGGRSRSKAKCRPRMLSGKKKN